MKKVFKPVMLCTAKEFKKVWNLAGKVISGMGGKSTTFKKPTPNIASLKKENDLLGDLITQAKGNHNIKDQRDVQSAKVFAMLQKLLLVVNTRAAGDKTLIDESGFTCSAEPTPQPIPDKVLIKRVMDGKTTLSAKIFVQSNGKRVMYIVQSSLTPLVASSFATILQVQDSSKLIIPNLVRLQEIFFRVAAINSSGQGQWSEPISFVAR